MDMEKQLVISKFRVKIKHLAAESRIIKQEERRLRKRLRRVRALHERNGDVEAQIKLRRSLFTHNVEVLSDHRVDVVRPEARATQWAYAYLRGVPYSVIEARTKIDRKTREDIAKRASQIATSLGGQKTTPDVLTSWLDESLKPMS